MLQVTVLSVILTLLSNEDKGEPRPGRSGLALRFLGL